MGYRAPGRAEDSPLPILYWHVYRIFATDIAKQVTEPYAKDKIETKIHVRRCPNLELDKPLAEVAAMGEISREEAEKRLHRGDALAMAYASGEPAGYGWISFLAASWNSTSASPGSCTRVSGALRNFVHPRWRGRGIQSSINTAVNEYARGRGVSVTYGSISAMNAQSLSLAKHYDRATAMKVTLILVRLFNWRICRDFLMPRLSGLQAAEQILKVMPLVPIVLYTMYGNEHLEAEAKKIGTRKVFSKADSSTLVPALEDIFDWMSRDDRRNFLVSLACRDRHRAGPMILVFHFCVSEQVIWPTQPLFENRFRSTNVDEQTWKHTAVLSDISNEVGLVKSV